MRPTSSPARSRRWRAPLLSLALLLTPSAACFDEPAPACAFSCPGDGPCGDGYRCADDGWCKREDLAEDYECGGPAIPPDASSVDAPVADAAPDASADAASDAAPDATPDADIDAAPGASGAASGAIELTLR
ncbi:hypothetical protein [Haliangium ochraceum]|uniref:Lipoprotein n=1 Tax=Haliangium ochraceum (strain DSM 14365 / JCM 11303 / SMP-2) TaxID=502025 RepID=D0LKY2_HALO1|nr:hypothetical protein [Haliangium ochraceum]ACY16702.1 hypothetical protein Hoch_4204 [Haliangium ochraceum DSM 14365]